MMLLLMLLFQSMQFTHKTTFPCFIYSDNYSFYHLRIPFLNPLQGLNALHTPQLFVPIMGRLPNTLYLYTHTTNSTQGDRCVCQCTQCTFTQTGQIFMNCDMIQVMMMCHMASSYSCLEDCINLIFRVKQSKTTVLPWR